MYSDCCKYSNYCKANKTILVYILLICVTNLVITDAWKQCAVEEGGGVCPEGNTCCRTADPGISSCIPGKKKDPQGASGHCCDPEGATGCAYGYDCEIKGVDVFGNNVHKHKQQEVCKLRKPHPGYLKADETPRYELCRLPSSSLSSEMLQLQKFPINGFNAVYYSSMGSILPTDDKHHVHETHKFSSVETVLVIVHGSERNADDYLCAGISTALQSYRKDKENNSNDTRFDSNDVKDSDLIDIKKGKVLVIAPKFVADIDHDDRSHFRDVLYWLEKGPDVTLAHTWRYGANAANTGLENSSRNEDDKDDDVSENKRNKISSYTVMDRLLEFLISSRNKNKEKGLLRQNLEEEMFSFPKLNRIVVAGHSAGGQYVHRWAMLSSSPTIWGDNNYCGFQDDHGQEVERSATKNRTIEVRIVVANPRSYCYPDKRRMISANKHGAGISRSPKNDTHNNYIDIGIDIEDDVNPKFNIDENMDVDEPKSFVYAVPDPHSIATCPTYDQWEWGLEPGGDISVSYKDDALNLVHNNITELAFRYSKRKVFYLAGEQDTILQEDHCETYSFQGDNRNQRAKRYFKALSEYFRQTNDYRGSSSVSDKTKMIHQFEEIPGSPHDHTLMFQSELALNAFYGSECKNSVSIIKKATSAALEELSTKSIHVN
mmetsp:Transcript_843/g.1759  ORF Transcript_843/g.1759 Transcript_843/m.1759 type:complete len:659 (-) Transcript_843:227-2203(-)